MFMFFDTETTGIPDWHSPSGGPDQPHMVQLCALLTDDAGQEVEVHNWIIRPDGWVIPSEMTEIHGITQDRALVEGVDEKWAAEQIVEIAGRAERRIAHNEPFDARILRIAFKRYGMEQYADEAWKNMPRDCTARLTTPICKIPPTDKMMATGRKTFKTPKLEEAHEILFGEKPEKSHDALFDVRACARIFFHLRNMEHAA